MRNLSIRAKITLLLIAFFAVLAAIQAMVMHATFQDSTELLMLSTLENSQQAFDALERESLSKLGATLDTLIDRDDFRDLYLSGDRQALFDYAQPLFEELEEEHAITHWYFIRPEPESTVFVRIHNEEKYDDLVERITYRQAVETGEYGKGKELGQTAFALRSVKPYYDGDELIGYMELGQEIDRFLDEIKQQTSAEYAMFVEKEHLDQESWASVAAIHGVRDTWDDHPLRVLVDSTTDDESLLSHIDFEGGMLTSGMVLDQVESDGRTYVRGEFPVFDAEGRIVGEVLAALDITEMAQGLDEARNTLMLVTAILILVLGISGLFVLNRLVFARVGRMMKRLEDISTRLVGGDFDVAGSIPEPRLHDEIGKFEEFFARFVGIIGDALGRMQDPDERS